MPCSGHTTNAMRVPQYLLVSHIRINAWILAMHSSSWTGQGDACTSLTFHGLADDNLGRSTYNINPEAGVRTTLQLCQAAASPHHVWQHVHGRILFILYQADLHSVTSSKLCSCWVLLNVRGIHMHNHGREAGPTPMMKHTHTAFVCLNSTAQPATKALTLYLCFKQACRTDPTITLWHLPTGLITVQS